MTVLAGSLALLLASLVLNVWALRSMTRNRRTIATARRRLVLLELAVRAELARLRRAPR